MEWFVSQRGHLSSSCLGRDECSGCVQNVVCPHLLPQCTSQGILQKSWYAGLIVSIRMRLALVKAFTSSVIVENTCQARDSSFRVTVNQPALHPSTPTCSMDAGAGLGF
jgi:hypothetical protein